MISLLLAMDRNHVIGLNGDMPWHLPRDLAFFKKKTTGHTVVMGRKTFESIGKPLPNRKNVVLTSGQADAFPKEVKVMHRLDDLLKANENNPQEEFFVIGGGHVFEQILSYADRMYITFIDEVFDGDTFFLLFPILTGN
ncbi:dihydrofolate reductase [Virgibacillus sp. 179-BFC.A HS]|uniref:dihydrofolate reductase n=1 Tax=Tigheibacillus jepli TaxID=3035914 RepID=A0ABU5CJT3_9BACI|nr:dihydrofolate reductase [Virgibacillus sp. 179-BFC.A HS]MDY0405745.1 dihydrofolate reductase [Virgibacillus sp. 179-BFC.A HS]